MGRKRSGQVNPRVEGGRADRPGITCSTEAPQETAAEGWDFKLRCLGTVKSHLVMLVWKPATDDRVSGVLRSDCSLYGRLTANVLVASDDPLAAESTSHTVGAVDAVEGELRDRRVDMIDNPTPVNTQKVVALPSPMAVAVSCTGGRMSNVNPLGIHRGEGERCGDESGRGVGRHDGVAIPQQGDEVHRREPLSRSYRSSSRLVGERATR